MSPTTPERVKNFSSYANRYGQDFRCTRQQQTTNSSTCTIEKKSPGVKRSINHTSLNFQGCSVSNTPHAANTASSHIYFENGFAMISCTLAGNTHTTVGNGCISPTDRSRKTSRRGSHRCRKRLIFFSSPTSRRRGSDKPLLFERSCEHWPVSLLFTPFLASGISKGLQHRSYGERGVSVSVY